MTIVLPENVTALDLALAQEVRARRLPASDALHIRNVHLRVEVLVAVDGWSTVLGACSVLDQTSRGTLYAAPWITTPLLKVVCPSTNHNYVLTVPAGTLTVDKALAFVNGTDKVPELES